MVLTDKKFIYVHMYRCMFVYVNVLLHVCIYVCIYVCVYCMYMCVCISLYVWMDVYLIVYVNLIQNLSILRLSHCFNMSLSPIPQFLAPSVNPFHKGIRRFTGKFILGFIYNFNHFKRTVCLHKSIRCL